MVLSLGKFNRKAYRKNRRSAQNSNLKMSSLKDLVQHKTRKDQIFLHHNKEG